MGSVRQGQTFPLRLMEKCHLRIRFAAAVVLWGRRHGRLFNRREHRRAEENPSHRVVRGRVAVMFRRVCVLIVALLAAAASHAQIVCDGYSDLDLHSSLRLVAIGTSEAARLTKGVVPRRFGPFDAKAYGVPRLVVWGSARLKRVAEEDGSEVQVRIVIAAPGTPVRRWNGRDREGHTFVFREGSGRVTPSFFGYPQPVAKKSLAMSHGNGRAQGLVIRADEDPPSEA